MKNTKPNYCTVLNRLGLKNNSIKRAENVKHNFSAGGLVVRELRWGWTGLGLYSIYNILLK